MSGITSRSLSEEGKSNYDDIFRKVDANPAPTAETSEHECEGECSGCSCGPKPDDK